MVLPWSGCCQLPTAAADAAGPGTGWGVGALPFGLVSADPF